MCATCVAQGAAYLVPAYAVVRTWQQRRRASAPDGAPARAAGPQTPEVAAKA